MAPEYDTIEQSNLAWLQSAVPKYLAFHKAHAGHLPVNFVDSESGTALTDSDARWAHINRIGYLNYAIFVNLALARDATSVIPSSPSILDVYDLAGRTFLRLGAAIDQAEALEVECARTWNAGDLRRGTLPNPSLYGTLRTALAVVDKYNNFLKHNGLPAILVDSNGALLVPDSLDYKKQKLWKDQKPASEFRQLLTQLSTLAFSQFDVLFGALTTASATRLVGLQLDISASPVGIQTLVATGHSGSLAGLDGYQPAGPRSKP